MEKRNDPGLGSLRTRLSRRDLLGFAAKGAASVIVTQSLLSCASSSVAGTDNTSTTGTDGSTPACVLTAALTSAIHANSPYNTRGQRNTINTTDGIYSSLSSTQKSALTLQASKSGDGYAGTINLGVQVG
jgi:hypothetical protein